MTMVTVSPALPRGMFYGDHDLDGRLYLRPVGLVYGSAAASLIAGGHGWSLAGGALAYSACEILIRDQGQVIAATAPFHEILDWSEREGAALAGYVAAFLGAIGRPRQAFAGLELDRPLIMGVVNVTPDSFSDGGRYLDHGNAISHAFALMEQGADILDIGGESTRPGAQAVAPEEEIRRVVPVVRALAEKGAIVSIDTRHAAVMAAAVEAGAAIINDVTALTGDPDSLSVAAKSQAAVILMHMQGDPATMQDDPVYEMAALDVFDYLAGRIRAARSAGIAAEKLCIDPGIGFGKSLAHNIDILTRLSLYHGLGCPLLLGLSRKSFIARLSKGEGAGLRLPGSLGGAWHSFDQGAQIIRVHDVAETAQARAVWQAIRN